MRGSAPARLASEWFERARPILAARLGILSLRAPLQALATDHAHQAQTLTDREYQRLRDDALKVLDAVGVVTGGSNVQFAVDPKTGRMVVIEMNPRAADAYYYMGEILLEYGKPIEARAQWREALIVDPSHYGARLRYYK